MKNFWRGNPVSYKINHLLISNLIFKQAIRAFLLQESLPDFLVHHRRDRLSNAANWSFKSSFGLIDVAVNLLSRLREFKKLVNNS